MNQVNKNDFKYFLGKNCVFFGVILWPNVTITNSHIYFGKDAFIRLTTTRCQGMACIAWTLEIQKRFV